MKRATAIWAWCGAAATAVAQTGTLDQSSPRAGASYNESASSLIWQQQVRCGIAGELEGIRVTLLGPVGAVMTMSVRLGAGPSTNPVVFTTMLTKQTAASEDFFVDMRSADIELHVNDLFVMETQGNDTGANLVGSYVDPTMGPPLYPEPLFLNGGPFPAGWRHGFDTFMLGGAEPVCYANCDQSTQTPFLNVNDFICFQTRFAAGDSYANCDASTAPPVLNVNDFICFQTRFAAGCSAP